MPPCLHGMDKEKCTFIWELKVLDDAETCAARGDS
jgi:hypothetical protein